ncbi:MAG: ATP-binding protein [Anaerolineae bacterium]
MGDSEVQEQLAQRLRYLNEISLELTKAPTLDELFRIAVEKGRTKLGFDRMAIFLTTDSPFCYVPTFGTDESGNTRDERLEPSTEWNSTDSVGMAIASHKPIFAREDVNLYNHRGEVVGRGWHVISMLWDGDEIIGWLTVDNLLRHRPLTPQDVEILQLYGISLGHLTTHKRIEEDLIKERNLLRTIIDNTMDYVYTKDTDLRFTMANRPFYLRQRVPQTTSEQEVIGKTDFDHYPEAVAAQYAQDEMGIFRTGEPIHNRQDTQVTATGEEVVLLTTKVPLRDNQGNITGLVGVSRDITDLKRSERDRYDLQLQRDRVDLMNELVSNLSHDLKTSLSIISTSLYLVARLDEPSRQRDKISTIEKQIHRLGKIIEDTLYLSRLHHAVESTAMPQDVNQLLHDLVMVAEPRLAAKHLTAELDLCPDKLSVSTYDDAIARMFSNLLENAITYTPDGGTIKVLTRVQDREVVVEIADTGVGIREENLKRVFEPFYRVDESRSIEMGGAGLGLAIVKQIAVLHNGSVEAESAVNRGSTFRMRLPLS